MPKSSLRTLRSLSDAVTGSSRYLAVFPGSDSLVISLLLAPKRITLSFQVYQQAERFDVVHAKRRIADDGAAVGVAYRDDGALDRLEDAGDELRIT